MNDFPYTPFKIEIERNTSDTYIDTPFFVTINGKHLKNVKRFYIDLDKDKLLEKHIDRGSEETKIKKWIYNVEYEDYPDDDQDCTDNDTSKNIKIVKSQNEFSPTYPSEKGIVNSKYKTGIINEIVDILKKHNLTYTEGKDILLASCKQIGNTIINFDSLEDNL